MARKVHLHARDREILVDLVGRRVESVDYMHATYWPDMSRKTVRNRLGELVRAGYLEQIERSTGFVSVRGGRPRLERYYALGPKAPAALRLRGLAGEHFTHGRLRPGIADDLLDHQLAVNRVGDWLGARLLPEHLLSTARGGRRHRPDAAYRAAQPDGQGRDLVLVEVDLGHYSRKRILAKVETFLAHPRARSIIFATPTGDRRSEIARWIREHYGLRVMERVQTFDFDTLCATAPLDAGTEPDPAPVRLLADATDWHELI